MRFIAILFLLPATAVLARDVDFSREVLPILADACYHCHGPDEAKREAKLRLDTKDGLYRSEGGITVVKPGSLSESELIARILSRDEEEVMPPRKATRQLKAHEIETLKRWVQQGAPFGQHWAYEPMRRDTPPPPPAGGNAIDGFILKELKKHGIPALSPPADKARLLRRVTLDLTGLPPTPEELDAFLADDQPDAYSQVVDRLLASPRHAERLATEWLDLARFADTHGYQMDRHRPMWAYRDWVIDAFQKNQPYDRFVTEQLAGDLLPGATQAQRLATAFNRLHNQNEEGGIVEEEYRVAYVVDRVNTFGTAFLGMTMECSRCHDHKYDPITTRDFYSLFAFFQNIDESGQTSHFTDSMPVPTVLLSTPEQEAKLTALREKIAAAERAFDAAQAGADADFSQWLDKLPEGAATPHIEGEVARYPLDILEKGESPNAIPGGKPAKAHESPTPVKGREGQAVLLDGENGLIFPDVGHFDRADAFTLALWIRVEKHAARAVILHHSKAPIDAGSRGYEILLEDGRAAFGLHHMWPGNSLKVATRDSVPEGRWMHLTATYDGSSRAAGARLYLDGLPVPLTVVRDGLTKDITYGGGEPELTVGYRFRDSGFKGGLIDDLRIFQRALTPIEISALAGRDDYARSVQAFPELAPEQRSALRALYVATVHTPSVDAARALHAARDEERKFINPIPEAMAMQEMSQPRKAYILQRGAYDARGPEVTADTPKILPPFPADAPRNRLGLARWLTHPEHPLMARVTVNRYWQMLFGRGLVETADNFGTTGATCTHPELLDWLARDFIASGWDLRHLLRQIVHSATYRQSTIAMRETPNATADPALFARHPARRLTAEMIRDSALAVSGLLVEKIGGPSVKPYQPPGLWEEIAMGKPTYHQGKGADLYRRSLYTYWKRTVPPPAMVTFDAADRATCTVQRQSTATPLQALALLNDVQIVEAARHLAQRTFFQPGADSSTRIADVFRRVTSRHPTAREITILERLYAEQLAHFRSEPSAANALIAFGDSKSAPALPPAELAAATTLCLALLNHDEALHRR